MTRTPTQTIASVAAAFGLALFSQSAFAEDTATETAAYESAAAQYAAWVSEWRGRAPAFAGPAQLYHLHRDQYHAQLVAWLDERRTYIVEARAAGYSFE